MCDIWQKDLASEHEAKIIIRQVWAITLKERKKNSEFKELLCRQPVTLVIMKDKVRWFTNDEQRNDAHWSNQYLTMKTDRTRFIIWCQ